MQLENVEDIYTLSPMQQGMLFHTLYEQGTGAYFQQVVYTVHGALDAAAFRRAWQQVVDRHAALRTAFLWQGLDEPLQVVRQQAQLPWAEHDWRGAALARQQQLLEALLAEQRQRGFELDASPLMNCTLIRIAEESFWFVWNHHHIILDGWSVAIVLGEVFALYEAFCRGEPAALGATPPYRDYIAWLQQQDSGAAAAFWRRALQGFAAPTPLPEEKAAAPALARPGGWDNRALELSRQLTDELRALAQRHQLTLNTLIRGTWAILLSRSSGMEDVLFGCTTSGRPATLPAVESTVGLFINTLPARVQASWRASLIPWLQELQAQQVQQDQYAYSPLVDVQSWSEVPRGVPLFESLLVFENAPAASASQVEQSGLTISDIRYNGRTSYPLTVEVTPGPELLIAIQCATDRFEAGAIARMLGHLQALLQAIAANPRQQLGAIAWLTESEYQQIVVQWNATEAAYPAPRCIHHLIEAQAAQTPDAVAVVAGDLLVTYAQLHQRADRLAGYLRSRGVGPDVLVGICMERSLEMVIGLLGVLKAGGAYVPLDPGDPPARLAYMLADSQVTVLLTQSRLLGHLPQHTASVICPDTEWDAIVREGAGHAPNAVTADNLAYVIYTSGSTGRPKGAMNAHSGLYNRLLWMQDAYQLNTADRVFQKTSFSFDVSVWEFFWPLISGACLVVARPGGHKDPPYLVKTIAEQQITTIHFVPSMLQLFIAQPDIERCGCLKRVICSGEPLPYDLQERFSARLDAELHNLYGPTEAAIDVTSWACERNSELHIVPIGHPIANTQISILDRQLQPVPVGVAGELYIGGVQLARGYLNRPDLTAEKFVPNPFLKLEDRGLKIEDSVSGAKGAQSSILYPLSSISSRLYKTGDLARYLPGGAIVFIGRADQQVKIRGFRIELAEIELTLQRHQSVREAVVLVREDHPGERQLVAYVVPNDKGQTLNDEASLAPISAFSVQPLALSSELRTFLQEHLPDYMVPAAFMVLEALPLTASGKVDRRALPAPRRAGGEREAAFVAPRTFVEEKLAALWGELLHIVQVGVEDNFFVLGGHSLLLMRLASHIQEIFEVDIPLSVLFDKPTVADMSRAVAERLVEEVAPEDLAEVLEEIDALSADELQALLQAEAN